MAARNVVTIEFQVIGDGLAQIEKGLAGVSTGAKRVESESAKIKRLTTAAFGAERGLVSLLNTVNLVPAGASSAVSGITALAGSFAGLSSAVVPIGIALAAQAIALAAVGAAAIGAAKAFAEFAHTTIGKAEELRRATLGLENIARFKGLDPAATVAAVRDLDLVKSGLLSVGDASKALQNLLRSGFSLEESIALIKTSGDSAAFGRQQHLEFGEAIVRSSEGIRQGNSILADADGLTTNLGVALKRAGIDASKLSEIQENAAVRQAIYNSRVAEAAPALGSAARLAEGYTGALAKMAAGTLAVEQKFGGLLLQNTALVRAFQLGATAVSLVNENFDTYLKGLAVFAPVAQFLAGIVGNLAAGFFGIAAGIGAALEGLAALRTATGQGNVVENAALGKLGADLRTIAWEASKTAASLPKDIAKIRAAIEETTRPIDLKTFDITGLLANYQRLEAMAAAITAEAEKRAAIEEASVQRQLEAFAKTVELAREREGIIAGATLQAATRGLNPLEADFRREQAKIANDARERLDKETDRIGRERAQLLSQIAKEKDAATKASLQASLPDLDTALVAFSEANREFAEAQDTALRVDFAGRFADQMQAASRRIFDVAAELRSDNPFVDIFRSAATAVADFDAAFGRGAADTLGFASKIDELARKQAEIARANLEIQGFDLEDRQRRFAEQVGLGPLSNTDDRNRRIFEQFEQLTTGSEATARIAAKFLTDAAEAGRLDVSILTGDQQQAVLQAYSDLQVQITAQEQEGKKLAQEEKNERIRLARQAHDDAVELIASLDANTLQNAALAKIIRDKNLLGIIDVIAGEGLTAEERTPAGGITP
jgi:hypothetical protein